MKLDKVVPFGRSLDEYIKMFHLSSEDLPQRILGVGDGPASFNLSLIDQLIFGLVNEMKTRGQVLLTGILFPLILSYISTVIN